MKTALESFRIPLTATGDLCILCEQRPLEHSADGFPWSLQGASDTKAESLTCINVFNSHNDPRRWGTEIQRS